MSEERERAIREVLAYHRLSSLDPLRPAAAPAKLERTNEPIPFRRYLDTLVVRLPEATEGPSPPFPPLPADGERGASPHPAVRTDIESSSGVAFYARAVGDERENPISQELPKTDGLPGKPFDLAGLGRFLDDALGLAGWKRADEAAFGMRRTPSAGNLHPTEAYLLTTGGVAGLAPGLYHYSSFDHALELRRELRPGGSGLYVALTTIYWRSAWKYGERAFRLCHLDAGHAAASLAASAAIAGWALAQVEIGDEALESLLGLAGTEDPEAERAILLFAIDRPGEAGEGLPETGGPLLGRPSRVSPSHRDWPGIAQVHRSTLLDRPGTDPRGPDSSGAWRSGKGSSLCDSPVVEMPAQSGENPMAEVSRGTIPLSPAWTGGILRRRRSTAVFDGERTLGMPELRCLLAPVTAPGSWLFPFRHEIGVLLFVHRVDGLRRGLYLLEAGGSELRAALRPDFGYERAAADVGLLLALLAPGDARTAAASLAGGQEAAGSSSFTAVLVGRLAGLAAQRGAWVYRALHWQAGEIGHRLCLAAAAAGLGATGLSGFHDERLATFLGLGGGEWLPLYLVAVGPKAAEGPALEPTARHRETNAAPRPPSRGGYE